MSSRQSETRKKWHVSPLVLRLASLALVLTVWELFGRSQPIFFSYPTQVASAFYEMTFVEGSMVGYFSTTLNALLVGYLIAVVAGTVIGLLMGRIETVRVALEPYVNALYATPRITIIPLLIIWLGVGYQMRITIVMLSAVFPIIINTYNGAMSVDRRLIDVGHMFLAGRAAMARTVILPGALPYVFAGLRVSLLRALSSVIIAETTASLVGTGAALFAYGRAFQTDRVFAIILVLGFLGIGMGSGIERLQHFVAPWSNAARQRKTA